MSPPRFARLDTPLGPMVVILTDAGVAAIDRGDVRGGAVDPPSDETERVTRQLHEYFAGRRRSFDLVLDLHGASDFARRVYRETQAIPYGETATYGEVAIRIGRPGAARAVGSAMSHCPLSPIVPCHRVVHAAGGFGGWGGDPSVKRWLLDLEQVESSKDRQGPVSADLRPHAGPSDRGAGLAPRSNPRSRRSNLTNRHSKDRGTGP